MHTCDVAPPTYAMPDVVLPSEILERRYPVVLRRFELRQGSGGAGRHKGGEGVVREVGGRVGGWQVWHHGMMLACE
jgi:N-methylhydantoinase B/oxoprolinase/acetone carboxylase alpha subunit